MDKYLLLRFAHLIGLMLMSAGVIGVFVADMRSRQVRDVKLLAQAVTFIAVFYDGLVVPGALLLLASGTWLIISYYGGWQFLKTPWLVGMVILFGLEFIEGNTITRLYFMRLRRLARLAVTEGHSRASPCSCGAPCIVHALSGHPDLAGDRLSWLIVSLGALRPSDWTQFVIGIVLAVAAASLLNYFIPRLYPWGGDV